MVFYVVLPHYLRHVFGFFCRTFAQSVINGQRNDFISENRQLFPRHKHQSQRVGTAGNTDRQNFFFDIMFKQKLLQLFTPEFLRFGFNFFA